MKEALETYINNHEGLFMLVTLLPIILIRIVWNFTTYNKIHGTNYVPFFQYWQKGGMVPNYICTFAFFWLQTEEDSTSIRNYKKIANWISFISVCIAIVGFLLVYMLDLNLENRY